MNPSHISNIYPWSSVFKKAEHEIIAQNILKILKRTGDRWRKMSWDEYVLERQRDGLFSESEKMYFHEVVKYTYSADAAARFSNHWAQKLIHE